MLWLETISPSAIGSWTLNNIILKAGQEKHSHDV